MPSGGALYPVLTSWPRASAMVRPRRGPWRRGPWPVWRRVRLPATATLADLHQVIQVLFGWDRDHLHLFAVGKSAHPAEPAR
jgi:pRiA4b ORF-3-like protein